MATGPKSISGKSGRTSRSSSPPNWPTTPKQPFRPSKTRCNRYEEILACWALGGGFDYLIQIVTRDIDAYQRLIDTLLDARIGIARYFTYIVTKQVKGGGTPPLGLFTDHLD